MSNNEKNSDRSMYEQQESKHEKGNWSMQLNILLF